jgi:hypothetical protein
MDDSSNTQSDSLPLSFLATSVLGIQSPLHLRPHGSTQKPHIILRRVTVSGDSGGGGGASNIVRFSLFAAKRIEVKPGKEILLTVASPDGYFEDQPVVFEADIAASGETSDEKSDTLVAEEEDVYLPPAGEAIPPKMRRAWTKKVEEVSSVVRTCRFLVFCVVHSLLTVIFFSIDIRRASCDSFICGCTGRTRVRFGVDTDTASQYTGVSTDIYQLCVDIHSG